MRHSEANNYSFKILLLIKRNNRHNSTDGRTSAESSEVCRWFVTLPFFQLFIDCRLCHLYWL